MRRVLIALLCATGALSSACTTTDRTTVDENLTSDMAVHRVVGYLEDLVGALPEGTTLSRTHPDYPTAAFRRGSIGPCYDGNTVEDGPADVGAIYWVVGMPAGADERYFGLVLEYWKSQEWTVDERTVGGTPWATALTPDRFAVTASINDDGDLTVSATSVCFPQRNSDAFGEIEIPETITGSR